MNTEPFEIGRVLRASTVGFSVGCRVNQLSVPGFGSLVSAHHQGIASLGMMMSIGTATCMAAGLTFLPTLLNWLTRHGWRGPGPKANPEKP